MIRDVFQTLHAIYFAYTAQIYTFFVENNPTHTHTHTHKVILTLLPASALSQAQLSDPPSCAIPLCTAAADRLAVFLLFVPTQKVAKNIRKSLGKH